MIFVAALLVAPSALASRLEVEPGASILAHLGAATLLYLHIAGGIVGLAAGTVALALRKGGQGHRFAGRVFFAAMAVTYLIGAGVAPFLSDGQRPNFVGGILALYLLISGVAAARKRPFKVGLTERLGLAVALAITGMGVAFMIIGGRDPSGTVDGSPPQAFILFAVMGSLGAIGDLRVIWRGTISQAARIARHLWRMCASFFIASASLFLGQAQLFPDAFNKSPAPMLLAFAPLILMLFFLVVVRLKWRVRTGAH